MIYFPFSRLSFAAATLVQNLIFGMVDQLMEGRVPEVNRPFDTLDLKMAIIRVNCWQGHTSHSPRFRPNE
jgi:hypothetical protein